MGAGPSDGTAIAIGLFPTTRSAPPGAGISGRVLHIDDTDAVLVGGLERETPRSPEMEAVTHRDQTGAETPGALDRNLDRLVACEMAERIVRIENDSCALVRDDLACLLQRDGPLPDPVEVHLDQHHAMRGLTLEIGIYQSPRDGFCRTVGDIGRNEKPRHQRAQLVGRNRNGTAHVTLCRSHAAV